MSKEPKRVCKNCLWWMLDRPPSMYGMCFNQHIGISSADVIGDDQLYPNLQRDDSVPIYTGPLFGCRFFKKKGVANAVEIPTIPDNG